jgi:hypothetical protein
MEKLFFVSQPLHRYMPKVWPFAKLRVAPKTFRQLWKFFKEHHPSDHMTESALHKGYNNSEFLVKLSYAMTLIGLFFLITNFFDALALPILFIAFVYQHASLSS